jgi:Ca2+-binding RTX toxin-like protein
MRRVSLLVLVASMMAVAVALSGVAQAKPMGTKPASKCQQLAQQTLGAGFDPSSYTFYSGGKRDDDFTGQGTAGQDVFCGFGGADSIGTLDQYDIFLGGDGNDRVTTNNGIFYGGAGNDFVLDNISLGTSYLG